MKTFFINTCTSPISIAIVDRNREIAKSAWASHRDEAERLQDEVKKLFKKSKLKPGQIDRIAVCIGPAGFTSARIGVSIANAWSFAMQIPLAQFSVFDCYPENAMVMIPCNQTEAWVREAGGQPRLKIINAIQNAKGNCFSKSFVQAPRAARHVRASMAGGGLEKSGFPKSSTLHFSHQLAHPWYYKDAKITWSKRIHSSLPCSSSSQPPSAISKTSPSAR